MSEFKEQVEALEKLIVDSYEDGVSMQIAQDHAARFLVAQLAVSNELKKADLDSRMRKTGVKEIRARMYLEECSKADKKPSDVLLGALVDSNALVIAAQNSFDESEVDMGELERLYNVFGNAHIHFRTISRGTMG